MTARSTSSPLSRRDALTITPLGDSAVVLHFGEPTADPSSEVARQVLGALQKLRKANLTGVLEIAPAYTTLAVFFDPTRLSPELDGDVTAALSKQIRQIVLSSSKREKSDVARIVEVPVCYDPEFALDLDAVARQTGLSHEEVVDLHARAVYRVSCVGFTPGFPYLSGLPDRLAVPRRAVPRKEVPAGSVAIGGKQTGIYPVKSPGGWNIIGRTPLSLFDPSRNPPALLGPGDGVRFRAITRAEFERSTQ